MTISAPAATDEDERIRWRRLPPAGGQPRVKLAAQLSPDALVEAVDLPLEVALDHLHWSSSSTHSASPKTVVPRARAAASRHDR